MIPLQVWYGSICRISSSVLLCQLAPFTLQFVCVRYRQCLPPPSLWIYKHVMMRFFLLWDIAWYRLVVGAWGSVVIKDGPGIDSWWCHWEFFLWYRRQNHCALRSTQPLKVSTRDFSWGKGGRCVWLTTYHPRSAETSRKSGAVTYPTSACHGRPLLYFRLVVGNHLLRYMLQHARWVKTVDCTIAEAWNLVCYVYMLTHIILCSCFLTCHLLICLFFLSFFLSFFLFLSHNIPYILESNPHPSYSFRGLKKSDAD